MTKLHHVKKAMKDYPKAGIKKGDSYYWWQHFRGPRLMSLTKPKPSQIASNDYDSTGLALVEGLQEWGDEPWTEEDRDELVSELETLRDEQQDSYDNLPQGLQQGDVGVMLEERVSALDEWIGELEGISFEDESINPLEEAMSTSVW